LGDLENLKAQFEKRIQANNAKLAAIQATSEFHKELNQLAVQEKRILDAYREEVIGLPDLKDQKEMISNRCKVLEAKKKAVLSQSEASGQPQITLDMLGEMYPRVFNMS
jgi:hypothetical protein